MSDMFGNLNGDERLRVHAAELAVDVIKAAIAVTGDDDVSDGLFGEIAGEIYAFLKGESS
jgi:dihydropteroate synthase